MKKITKCCVLLSICLVSLQGNAQLEREWVNHYSTSDTAYMNVIGLFDAGNGNVLKATLITKYLPPETFNRLLLQKIAPSGITVWEETYQHPQYDQFFLRSGGIDQNGNTYFSGQVTVSQSESDWFVISFDANGQERWQKGIVENTYSSGTSQFCVTDLQGNTYVSGNLNDNGSSLGTIVKYDEAGNEQWVKYDPSNYTYGTNMIIAANGDLIACDGQFELTRFTPNGNVLWNTPDTSDFIYVTPKISEAPDGSIYAASFLSFSYSLKKLNASGAFQWSYNQFAQNLVFGDNSLNIQADSQSNIYLAGINSTDQNEYHAAVFKFTPNADEIWRQELVTETYDVTDLLLVNDQPVLSALEYTGGPYYTTLYLLNGLNGSIVDSDSLSNAGTQHFLLRNEAGLYLAGTGDYSTSLVKYGGTLSIKEESVHDQMTVYPNPFTDEITVVIPGDGSNYECTDLSGKLVQKGMLNSGTTISLKSLAPGMYQLSIADKSGNRITKRIVKSL